MSVPRILAQRWGVRFAKRVPWCFSFFGSQKGPSAWTWSGIRSASDRARAGFRGQPAFANAKNAVFFARENARKKLRARSAAMTGAPRGARFRFPHGLLRSPGAALGPFWGPGGASFKWGMRKLIIFGDFWCFARRSVPVVGGSFLQKLIPTRWTFFGVPKRGPRRGY